MAAQIQPFGTLPDATLVKRIRIRGGGLTAYILTYGATVQDLRLDGVDHPLVLGSSILEPYLGPMTYFGAIVGRFANRIAKGQFHLDGETHQIPTNWMDRHALHGGRIGTGQKAWAIGAVTDDSLRLDLILPDGDMGFPGRMEVSATFSLTAGATLAIEITAQSDAATPCSFTHHGYFNLDGSEDVTDHLLQIDAPAYLPVDAELIPTGEVAPVTDTAFDFRRPCRLGTHGIDHNFCLASETLPLRSVAWLRGPRSGLKMTVETNQPGLQIYDSAYIPAEGLHGLDGRRYGPFGGIAMEPQCWPDAANRPDFPPAILAAGEVYRHPIRYRFARP